MTGFYWFVANSGKNEDEDEEISENDYSFWTLHPNRKL